MEGGSQCGGDEERHERDEKHRRERAFPVHGSMDLGRAE
jgi:hypothetical protein